MGGTHSLDCQLVAREIWLWAKERHIWLSADHIAGSDNIIADFKSRNFKENTEWKLSPEVFHKATATSCCPECDLFASWFPEPGSWIVNAFSIPWWAIKFYAFPPFSLIGRTLAKVRREAAMGIMIVPLWNTQAWFPLMLQLLVDHPRLIPPQHELLQKLALLAIHISGRHCTIQFISSNCRYHRPLLEGRYQITI